MKEQEAQAFKMVTLLMRLDFENNPVWWPSILTAPYSPLKFFKYTDAWAQPQIN